MSSEPPWNDLFADSMRTFADIEALGRRLAGSIAAEFAAHGADAQTSEPGPDADRSWPGGHQRRTGSMHDMTRDLLSWVDVFSDMARDTIFALADMTSEAFTDAHALTADVSLSDIGADGRISVPFWLHSSSGKAERIEPTITALTPDTPLTPDMNVDGPAVKVRIEPPHADVDPEHPAAFELVVDAAAIAPGSYEGLIGAHGVPDGLAVRIEVTA